MNKPQQNQYFPAVDGWRGIMAIGVVISHIHRGWFPNAAAMMDIFFVISGFLITLILLRSHQRNGHIQLAAFWWRRLKRLYPALITMVIFYVLLALILGRKMGPILFDALQTLLYFSNWTKIHNYFYAIYFGHTWSLSIEEQFYLLWPLWLTLLLKRKFPPLKIIGYCLALIALAFLWRNELIAESATVFRIYFATETRVDAFLSGGILAISWACWRDKWYASTWTAPLCQVSFILLVAAVLAWDPFNLKYYSWHLSAVILLSCLSVVAVASPTPNLLIRFLSWQPFQRLGLMCYGIYLWHWPLVWLLSETTLRPLELLAIVMPFTLIVTTLSYRYIEAPVLSKRGRFD